MIHKKRYYKSLCNDLLPVAWHPDRVVDWCVDEEEKRDLRRLWGSPEEEEEMVSTPFTIVRHVVDLYFADEEEELWGYLKTTLIHIRDIEGEHEIIVKAYNEAKEILEKARIKYMQDRQEKIQKIIKK